MDEHILRTIQQNSTAYKEIFPLGQPFKCLYGVHVLDEYLALSRRRTASSRLATLQIDMEGSSDTLPTSLTRGMTLVVAAIADPEVIARCGSHDLQIQLASSLLECFVCLLKVSRVISSMNRKYLADSHHRPIAARFLGRAIRC